MGIFPHVALLTRTLNAQGPATHWPTTISMSDSLFALRQAIKSNFHITYAQDGKETKALVDASDIKLSNLLSLPKSSPTRLRKPGASSKDPATKPQDFFSLEAVYLAWLLRDASGADYMKQARENGLAVGFVSVTERKRLVDWLEGKVSDLPNIVPLPCRFYHTSSILASYSRL